MSAISARAQRRRQRVLHEKYESVSKLEVSLKCTVSSASGLLWHASVSLPPAATVRALALATYQRSASLYTQARPLTLSDVYGIPHLTLATRLVLACPRLSSRASPPAIIVINETHTSLLQPSWASARAIHTHLLDGCVVLPRPPKHSLSLRSLAQEWITHLSFPPTPPTRRLLAFS